MHLHGLLNFARARLTDMLSLFIVRHFEIFANAFKNSKLEHKYVRINYLSKYSKYAEGLLRHRSYIHRSLP
jgi:hypothetical protein